MIYELITKLVGKELCLLDGGKFKAVTESKGIITLIESCKEGFMIKTDKQHTITATIQQAKELADEIEGTMIFADYETPEYNYKFYYTC